MYVYAIEGDGRRYTAAQAVAAIDERSGRNIGGYIVRRAIPDSLRRTERASAYVAAAARRGGGFRVRREEADRELDAGLFR